MKLSTYIAALNEIRDLVPEGIDPDITYTRSILYGNCLGISYTSGKKDHHIEVRPDEHGLTTIETIVTERGDPA